MRVRFTKSYPPYNPGEIAGFEETRARQLVSGGVAVFHRESGETPAPRVASIEQPPRDKMVRRPKARKKK